MCGIFGFIDYDNYFSAQRKQDLIKDLFNLSYSRGKDSSGIALLNNSELSILKQPLSSKELIKTPVYKKLMKNSTDFKLCFAHARMETNGSFTNNDNNQPVIKNGYVTVHNGIITNDKWLWNNFLKKTPKYQVDTEVINTLIANGNNKGSNLTGTLKKLFKIIEGNFSLAIFCQKEKKLLLLSNNGSLFLLQDRSKRTIVFSSEKYFLELVKNKYFRNKYCLIKQVIGAEEILEFDLLVKTPIKICDISPKIPFPPNAIHKLNLNNEKLIKSIIDKEYIKNIIKIRKLRRCSRCILPETMPFIKFDDDGVCNYCHSYVPRNKDQESKFKNLIKKYKADKFRCLVPFSGGRDSSFGVSLLTKKYNLKPITFTYDWGMITDLSRRNIARMCGKLGLENILISADIAKKRRNVRKNVLAWLKNPKLGLVPLFMAGDKQFFYYVNKIKKENNIKLNIWMGNRYENTDFKTGFCGVSPNFNKKLIDHLDFKQKLKLFLYYAIEFIKNPAYINSSLFDSFWAYISYYFEPRIDYYLLYDFIKWDEKLINKTLINDYHWETDPEFKSTWRIGDGTASWYNYIYYTMAGFSENDTFKSNQIREGEISRKQALVLSENENRPRIKSLIWYLNTIEIDALKAILAVNQASKLY